MLQVRWKIGKKPQGNWMVPIEMKVEVVKSEELKFLPRFDFHAEYKLPGYIYGGSNVTTKGDCCQEIDILKIHLEEVFVKEPLVLLHERNLFCEGCSSRIACKFYLPFRKTPDYSDFEKIFSEMANDLVKRWNYRVKEAASSPEMEEKSVVVTPFTISQNQNIDLVKDKKLTTRKIKV